MSSMSGNSSVGEKASSAAAELESRLKHMDLTEGELDDVFITVEEVNMMRKEARWMAIAKVNTEKFFSPSAFLDTMRHAWGLAREPMVRAIGDNLFILQMFCLGDWKKVMFNGPWTFRGLMLLIEEYDGRARPEAVVLSRTVVWAQIHGISELYRKPSIVEQLAKRIGKVSSVEMNPIKAFEGDYVRIRVSIDVAKPLVCFSPLTPQGEARMLLEVKYEKMGYFCEVCGLLGHNMDECGDGVHSPYKVQYGRWLLEKRKPNPIV